ncbi:uncharacterized protein FSUBG_4758 [Fusarium subglutinans]|uniref:Xylanolytic transcriptional activator regulatory domain-containing protein n=1 Tax=Gibberella subglutinans TaxID=42677 RepID=A0A8H5V284_GIBSU|nr:uncharacterized protein FSUBG_4758 [Fusarium subglutinans]KAF5608222.1 hypothetical protein FSUBG_4758 [Fusarium subglutinans]
MKNNQHAPAAGWAVQSALGLCKSLESRIHRNRMFDQFDSQVMLISASRDPNEAESSRVDGRVETAEGSSERLPLEKVITELKDFERQQRVRLFQEDDVEMDCTEDEPFSFSTVTPIYPEEGYEPYDPGTPDMEDEDPKYPEGNKGHELSRSARSARYLKHDCPPSVSNLPLDYHQLDQDIIIDAYFDGVNPATPLFSQRDYEHFEKECREPDTDSKRAGLVHAKAVKVVYGLGLHKWYGDFAKLSSVRFVWIAYIMDRELSLLTRQPYLMQEHDIGSSVTEISYDHGGILHNEDKSLHFKILQFRAELATIQGKIFDLVYSVRASQLSFDQRETVADRLDEMLEKWVESIPVPFRGDTLPGFGQKQLRLIKQLHVTYYHCIFSVRQATLCNRKYSIAAIELPWFSHSCTEVLGHSQQGVQPRHGISLVRRAIHSLYRSTTDNVKEL